MTTGVGLARVDDDDLDLFGLHALPQTLPIERRRMPHVVTVELHAIHLVDLRPRVGASKQGIVHGDGVAAADGARAADVGRVAEQVEETCPHGIHVAAVGSLVHAEGLSAELSLEPCELGRDLIESLVPGDPLPPVFPALADPLERIHELLGAVEPLDVVGHPVGAAAVGRGVLGVAAQTHQFPILHCGDEPALVHTAGRSPADYLLLHRPGGGRRGAARPRSLATQRPIAFQHDLAPPDSVVFGQIRVRDSLHL